MGAGASSKKSEEITSYLETVSAEDLAAQAAKLDPQQKEKLLAALQRKTVAPGTEKLEESAKATEVYSPRSPRPVPQVPSEVATAKPSPEKTEKPATEKPEQDKAESEKPATEKPEQDKAESEKPATEKLEEDKPESEKPATKKPEEEKTETEKPATEKPEQDKPETEKPGENKPESGAASAPTSVHEEKQKNSPREELAPDLDIKENTKVVDKIEEADANLDPADMPKKEKSSGELDNLVDKFEKVVDKTEEGDENFEGSIAVAA
jgi:hypothetical protein